MRTAALVFACLAVNAGAAAQPPTFRLHGVVKTDAGAPVDGAQVRAEALTGVLGQPFSGARVLTAKTNKKGAWSILGITGGTWVFEARADGLLPQVYVLPVALSQRSVTTGTVNPTLPWSVAFTLRTPAGPLAALEPIAKSATPENAQVTLTALSDVAKSTEPSLLMAVADVALLVRQPEHARRMFEQVAQRQPVDPLAAVGLASACMMQIDWDGALKHFWSARDTAPKDLRQALGAAITDLQKLGVLK